MGIVIGWIVLSAIVGAIAGAKDRSTVGWFLLSLLLSPLIGMIFLLIVGENRASRCPYCDERVKPRAKICPHCRSDIAPPSPIQIEGQRRGFFSR